MYHIGKLLKIQMLNTGKGTERDSGCVYIGMTFCNFMKYVKSKKMLLNFDQESLLKKQIRNQIKVFITELFTVHYVR